VEDRNIDRSELEEMISSSDHGTTFLIPTLTDKGCLWSFIVHESADVVEAIEDVEEASGSDDQFLTARGVLITLDSDGETVPVFVFLFRLEDDLDATYAVFMNPTQPHGMGVLEDLRDQQDLVVEFYDDENAVRVACANTLVPCIDQTIASLSEAEPCEDEAFDSAVGRLLAEHPEPENIWDLLDPTLVAIELEL